MAGSISCHQSIRTFLYYRHPRENEKFRSSLFISLMPGAGDTDIISKFIKNEFGYNIY